MKYRSVEDASAQDEIRSLIVAVLLTVAKLPNHDCEGAVLLCRYRLASSSTSMARRAIRTSVDKHVKTYGKYRFLAEL